MALAWSRGLDKLVGSLRPRVIDDLQQEDEHYPLEKRGGVRMGGKVFGLVKQMGMGLGEQDPHHLIVVTAFGNREDEGKEMLAVDKPVSAKDVEHIEDAWVLKRCDPTLCHWPPATRRRHTSRLGGGRALSVDLLEN